jgi:hypothetical protein
VPQPVIRPFGGPSSLSDGQEWRDDVVAVCCVGVPVNLMRFPPVMADGQGFYHFVSRGTQPPVSQIPVCERELQEQKQTASL